MPRTHKTLPRLYVDTALTAGAEIALDKDQTNHLVNVDMSVLAGHFQ